jgi:ribonucleoside-diphosphate reductase alpha chain
MLSRTAEALLLKRYAHKGESAEGVLKRVAKAVSIRDDRFEKQLFEAMVEGVWFPNSPAIRNAGRKRGLLHACFILPIEDNIGSIFDTIRNMAVIFKSGGGVGINFSSLRPKGAALSSGGTSSGAISFMGIFNAVTETVKQGGFRRGALMGIMNPSHPEIFDFCRAKLRGDLKNFNLSVMVTDDFMHKATNHGSIELIHEGKVFNTVRAKDIFDLIVLGSWVSGDPAMLFFDRINKDNRLYPEVVIDTTNPCSEVGLPHYGACCLGSINTAKFVEGNNFNFDKFHDAVKMGARALLNMNTISHYPLPPITKLMGDLNPIGLGIMGFADTLIMLGIKYDSKEALNFIEQLGKPYREGSDEVAPDSFYKRIIAPTGSLSILADCSSGVEPVYAAAFERHLTVGIIEETRDIYKSDLCRTAHQVSPEWHLKIQATWQNIVDGGISKTINLPYDASVDDIKQIYLKAWKAGVKGVTVFRDGSIDGVLVSTEPQGRGKCDDEVCHL